ncbi:MAG: SDR family oxidoreductase [Polyangiaceae bacterium]|nr:SDR family oxidoreductase [Polyangiaceae bacterium]
MVWRCISDRTALVTGAARRIGRAFSLGLADAGVNVVVHTFQSTAEGQALCAELETRGVKAWPLAADLADASAISTVVARARDLAGPLDVLINNASLFEADTIEGLCYEAVERHLRINAWAPLVLSREFAHQTERGHIINLLDTKLDSGDPGHVSYLLSKHLLAALTRMLALECAPRISVNAVAPGLILPPPGQDMDYLERLSRSVPLQRVGSPQDVVQAALFLLRSEFVTGQVIHVDGGAHLGAPRYS